MLQMPFIQIVGPTTADSVSMSLLTNSDAHCRLPQWLRAQIFKAQTIERSQFLPFYS